jgi:hypothetical protein
MEKLFIWSIAPAFWKSEYWNMTLEEKSKVGIFPVYIEYNTDTSTHYPTNEGNDIVRAYRK